MRIIVPLSARDRGAVQTILRGTAESRYVIRLELYEHGRVVLAQKDGAFASFTGCDPFDVERQEAYCAALAAYALRQLVRSYGEAAFEMIDSEIAQTAKGSYQGSLNMFEIIDRYTGQQKRQLLITVAA